MAKVSSTEPPRPPAADPDAERDASVEGGRPESTVLRSDAGRPWPPPGPDTAWWRGEMEAPPSPVPPTAPGTATALTKPEETSTWAAAPKPPTPAQRLAPRRSTPPDARAEPPSPEPPPEEPDAAPESSSTNVGPSGFPLRTPVGWGGPVVHRTTPPESTDLSVRLGTDSISAFFEADVFHPPRADDAWRTGESRAPSGRHPTRPPSAPSATATNQHRGKDPRSPVAGLLGLLLFAFLAAFLAWFSAYPLWLSLGHGRTGTAIVTRCPVAGPDKRCADFEAADNSFTAHVTLIGPDGMHAVSGIRVAARVVSPDGSIAYAGDEPGLFLRWVPSLVLLLLCGFGIAWATGAGRLPTRRTRWLARLGSLAVPVLLLVGMLAVTW